MRPTGGEPKSRSPRAYRVAVEALGHLPGGKLFRQVWVSSAWRSSRMKHAKAVGGATALLLMLSALPLSAQTRSTMGGSRSTTGGLPSTTGSPSTQPGRHQPCWRQAGVSQSAFQQHRSIEMRTRSEVQSVCSDSSLTPQQRAEKIRQIREQARAQQESLLTPQQAAAFRSCRQQRGEVGHPGAGGIGPCGGSTLPMGKRGTTTANPAGGDDQ